MTTFTGSDNGESLDNGWTYDVIQMQGGDDKVYQTYDSDYFGLYQPIPSTVTTPGVWASYFTPAQNDDIDMGAGNDWLSVGAGSDTLAGGEGFDLLQLGGTPPTDPRMWQSWSRYITYRPDGPVLATLDLAAGTLSATGLTVDLTVNQLTVYGEPGTDVTFTQTGVGSYSHVVSGFEAIYGSSETDIMKGSDAAFELFGIGPSNGGDDRINGRGGFDVVTYDGIVGWVLADLRKGTSTVYSEDYGNSAQTITNIEGLGGGDGMDFLYGDKGDNLFLGSLGADQIQGGAGRDTLSYDLSHLNSRLTSFLHMPVSVVVDLARGRTTVEDEVGALRGIEDVVGSRGADTIKGDTGDNALDGRAGDDSIRGGAGRDTVTGGAGDDTLEGNANWDVLDYSRESGSLGVNVTLKSFTALDTFGDSDSVRGFEEVIGTDGKDLIKGDNGRNVIRGGTGRDNLGGLGGKDTLYGGDGRDVLGGGGGKDLLYGGKGDDTLFGNDGRDVLLGGKDADKLFGGAGADDVFGGKGDDQIKDANDETPTDGRFIFVNNLRDVLSGGGDAFAAAEALKTANHLYGGEGRDTVLGWGLLDGGDGNDVVRGGGMLSGGDGNDLVAVDAEFSAGGVAYAILTGGLGRDTIDGGGSSSTVDYTYAAQGVSVDLATGIARAGSGDQDTLTEVRSVHGSRHDDTLKDAADDFGVLSGGDGNDQILLRTSGEGDSGIAPDYATGGGGNDRITVTGSGWADVYGDNGNDVIRIARRSGAEVWGGGGNDRIDISGNGNFHGNGGKDTFIVRAPDSGMSLDGDANRDNFVFKAGAGAAAWVDGGSGRDTTTIEAGVGAGLTVTFVDFTAGEDRIRVDAGLAQSFDTEAEYLAHAGTQATADSTDLRIDLDNGAALIFAGLSLDEVPFSAFVFI